MAILTAKHCTIELTLIKPETPRGGWYDITLSLTYHHNDQRLTFHAPHSGISMQVREILKFIYSAKHYLETPHPPVALSKEGREWKFQFIPMECRFWIKFHTSTHPKALVSRTTVDFDMPLIDLDLNGSVACSISLLTEEVLGFINTFQQEFESI